MRLPVRGRLPEVAEAKIVFEIRIVYSEREMVGAAGSKAADDSNGAVSIRALADTPPEINHILS